MWIALFWSYKFFQTISYTVALVVVVLCVYKCRDHNEEIYTVETDYIKWVTRVPAFTVCPTVSGRRVLQQVSRYTNQSLITPSNITFLVNLARPRNSLCPGCPVKWLDGLPYDNLTALADILTPPCEALLIKCSWNGLVFPCCQYFQALRTRRGICYSMNSEQTSSFPIQHPMKLVTTFKNPKAELVIEGRMLFNMHIKDRKVSSFAKPRFHIPLGYNALIQYKFTETIVKDSAKQLQPTQRTCILEGEKSLPGYRVYHYSSCKGDCWARRQVEWCGCRHHLLPGEGPTCSVEGLLCLDLHADQIRKEPCGCKMACAGQDIQLVFASLQRGNDNRTSLTRIVLTKAPTERDVYYAKTTILQTLVGFVCLTRLVTTADLYDIIIGFTDMLQNYMIMLNLLRVKTAQILKIKRD